MNISAIEFQNQVGDYLYSPLPEPVMVENQGQTIGVFLGYGAYQQLVQRLEDAVWGARALEAEREGYLGAESLAKLWQMAEEKGVTF